MRLALKYKNICCCCWFSVTKYVCLFATPWAATGQAPLSSTVSQSLLKFMPTELVMLLNYFILFLPLLILASVFPRIRVFSSELALCIRWPTYWNLSFSISPSNESSGLVFFRIDWLITLQSKGLSRIFSSTTIQKHQFLSPLYAPTLTSINNYWKNHSFDYLDLYWQHADWF